MYDWLVHISYYCIICNLYTYYVDDVADDDGDGDGDDGDGDGDDDDDEHCENDDMIEQIWQTSHNNNALIMIVHMRIKLR